MKKISIPALKIVNNGIKIPDNIRPYYNQMIEYCKERRGGYISLVLYPPRKPRSTGKHSQNAHLNGHIQAIAEFTGEDFDNVKFHVKRKALKYGYPLTTTKLGETIPQSESDCSVEECAMLIKAVHEVADFLDFKLKEE